MRVKEEELNYVWNKNYVVGASDNSNRLSQNFKRKVKIFNKSGIKEWIEKVSLNQWNGCWNLWIEKIDYYNFYKERKITKYRVIFKIKEILLKSNGFYLKKSNQK